MTESIELERSKYAWERADSTTIEFCRSHLERKTQRPFSECEVRECLERIRASFPQEDNSAWLDWLDVLPVEQAEKPEVSEVHGAYAPVFLSFVSDFEETLRQSYGHLVSQQSQSVFDGISSWYLNRLVTASRYTLHAEWVASGQPYSQWTSKFLQRPRSAWRDLFSSYPLLLRHLYHVETSTRAAAFTALSRLSSDLQLVQRHFGFQGLLTGIEGGLSDCHRGGGCVIRFQFEIGPGIIYKPKPLEIDQSVMQFAECNPIGLRPLKILCRDNYGWMEDAEVGERQSPPAKSTGSLAAFFWLTNATDLHAENIFAESEKYVVFDLETLLSAPMSKLDGSPDELWRSHSVLTTQLAQVKHQGARRPNISGFDPNFGPGLLFPSIEFIVRKDQVEMGFVPTSITPQTSGQSGATDTQFCELLDSFHERVQGAKGQIRDFVLSIDDDACNRLVLRDTVFYDRLLERMRQPRFMRDARLLSADLLSLYVSLLDHPEPRDDFFAIIGDEISQLLRGDIPYFSAAVGKRHLHLSNKKLEGFFVNSGKNWALEKINGVEKSDLSEQSALLTLSNQKPYAEIAQRDYNLDDKSFLSEAATALSYEAFSPKGAPSRWVGTVGDAAHGELLVDPGLRDLFGGSWGILLAMEAAASVAGNGPYEFLEREAKVWERHLSTKVGRSGSLPVAVLGFTGLGGVIFAMATLAKISPERWDFLKYSLSLFFAENKNQLHKSLQANRLFDVIGGTSGFILALNHLLLLELRDETQGQVQELLASATVKLADQAYEADDFSTWKSLEQKAPLLGYAHGWAGAVCALASVRESADKKVREISEIALNAVAPFPRTCFERDGGWMDYRNDVPEELNRSWCNGYSGFLRGLQALKRDDLYTPSELQRMLDTLAQSVCKTDTRRFCCGEMGPIDLLIDLNRTDVIIENVTLERLLSFRAAGPENPELCYPGLFQGRAGIIYTAARKYSEAIPSLSGDLMRHL